MDCHIDRMFGVVPSVLPCPSTVTDLACLCTCSFGLGDTGLAFGKFHGPAFVQDLLKCLVMVLKRLRTKLVQWIDSSV